MSVASRKNIFKLIEAAQEKLSINEQFQNDLNATIERQAAEEQRPPSQSYKPSSLKCVRNMWFQVTGAEQDEGRTDSNLVGILQSGSDRHERIQSAVAAMVDYGIDCEYVDVAEYVKQRGLDYLEIVGKQGYETKLFHKDLNISFLCDGIIKYQKQYYILEIKTETIYKWQSRKGVDPEHLAQGTAYSVCLGIDQVMFLYENRDNCGKKVYLLEVTDDMKHELVLAKIELSDQHVKTLTVPPIPLDITKKTCQYCSYKTVCKAAGTGR